MKPNAVREAMEEASRGRMAQHPAKGPAVPVDDGSAALAPFLATLVQKVKEHDVVHELPGHLPMAIVMPAREWRMLVKAVAHLTGGK